MLFLDPMLLKHSVDPLQSDSIKNCRRSVVFYYKEQDGNIVNAPCEFKIINQVHRNGRGVYISPSENSKTVITYSGYTLNKPLRDPYSNRVNPELMLMVTDVRYSTNHSTGNNKIGSEFFSYYSQYQVGIYPEYKNNKKALLISPPQYFTEDHEYLRNKNIDQSSTFEELIENKKGYLLSFEDLIKETSDMTTVIGLKKSNIDSRELFGKFDKYDIKEQFLDQKKQKIEHDIVELVMSMYIDSIVGFIKRSAIIFDSELGYNLVNFAPHHYESLDKKTILSLKESFLSRLSDLYEDFLSMFSTKNCRLLVSIVNGDIKIKLVDRDGIDAKVNNISEPFTIGIDTYYLYI